MKIVFKLIASVILIIILCTYSRAWAETEVIFTVDVESNESFSLPEQLDAVCAENASCGLMEIARMLKVHGFAGTFFLSVFEEQRWGENAMHGITAKLQATGQDVALHTHPQWAYDPTRSNMYQYSLEEQTVIIRAGVRLLEKWTGLPVVAHRTGNYAADENTLKALQRNGLLIDSSLFLGHKHSRLNSLGLPLNLPSWHGQIIEIPVTVYQRELRPKVFGNMLKPVISIRKIDVDWFIDEQEARMAIDKIVEADLPYLVIFLHSDTLIRQEMDSREPVADIQSKKIFRAILNHVSQKRLKVTTMRELSESDALDMSLQGEDVLPEVTASTGFHRYIWHRLRTASTYELVLVIVIMALLGGGAVLAAVHRLRSGKNKKDYGLTDDRSSKRSGVFTQ